MALLILSEYISGDFVVVAVHAGLMMYAHTLYGALVQDNLFQIYVFVQSPSVAR